MEWKCLFLNTIPEKNAYILFFFKTLYKKKDYSPLKEWMSCEQAFYQRDIKMANEQRGKVPNC